MVPPQQELVVRMQRHLVHKKHHSVHKKLCDTRALKKTLLSFAAPIDLGGLLGNVRSKALLSNCIASDLAYSVAAWRDASTALFLGGIRPVDC